MSYKTLEIIYDIKSIPGIRTAGMSPEALDFRNEAMEVIEEALITVGVGEWTGADIGEEEVSIQFRVADYDLAETIVRQTVADTRFANIREILRAELDEDEEGLAEAEWEAEGEDSLDDDEYDSEEEVEDDGEIDHATIVEGLSEMGFDDCELLASVAQVCHRLLPPDQVEPEFVVDDETSHLGGVPDVPPEFEWPRYEGRPLAFLAQVDYFSQGLLLLFFYDIDKMPSGRSPEHRGSCRVLMIPKENTTPAHIPNDLPAACRFPQQPVSMMTDLNLPVSGSRIIRNLGLSENDLNRLKDLENDNTEGSGRAAHHLQGHPATLDGDMELICQLASNGIDVTQPELLLDPRVESLQDDAEEWVLLGQFDEDPQVGWKFGDSGRLFFWITATDYDSLDFDNVWAIVQYEPKSESGT